MNWLLVVNLNTSICPSPEGISPMDPAQSDALAEWFATFSRQAFILLFVTHVLQAGLGASGRAAASGGWSSRSASQQSSLRFKILLKFVLPPGKKLKGFPRRQSVKIGMAELLHDGVVLRF